jgi:hypothetical protein
MARSWWPASECRRRKLWAGHRRAAGPGEQRRRDHLRTDEQRRRAGAAGTLANASTLAIEAVTAYNGVDTELTNVGALDLAEGGQLTVPSGNVIANDEGGSNSAVGHGEVVHVRVATSAGGQAQNVHRCRI